MSESELASIKQTFMSMDTNKNGYISLEEFRNGIQNLSPELVDQVDQIYKTMDLDGSGQVEYTEFIAATLNKEVYMKREKLWQCFSAFDRDGSGKISFEELKEIIGNEQVKNMYDKRFWSDLLKGIDSNSDGSIDFFEFMQVMEQKSK